MVINVDGKVHHVHDAVLLGGDYFTETITALLEVTLREPVSVVIGKGTPSRTKQTVLELTTITLDREVTDALAAGLNQYYGGSFVINTIEDKPAAVKSGYRSAILRVAKERREQFAANLAATTAKRARDAAEAQQQRDSQPEDSEEWRNVYDSSGTIVDYIYAD